MENKKMNHDELVSLCQDGKITIDEFVFEQEDIREEYLAFLRKRNLKRSNDNAISFLDYIEKQIMYNQ
ncbi:MAG: hypothetical protein Q4G63_04350 [Bacteroidia bacterium]|nr:hypothetical protein [Bacteroidia bacterium]